VTIASTTRVIVRARRWGFGASHGRCAEGPEGARGTGAEGEQPGEHADAGRAEAPVPPDSLTEESRDERGDERAEIDPHVEHGEARVAPRAAGGIEITHERGDVRLQEAGPDHDQDEPEEERRSREHGRQADREMTEGDEHSAGPDRAPQAEPSVGDPAARQRREIDARGVDADDGRRGGPREAEAAASQRGGHVENEERTDPVVRESLPHLGEEQRGQAARMTEEAPVVRDVLDPARRLVVGEQRFVRLR
jgi:hypothetical protein